LTHKISYAGINLVYSMEIVLLDKAIYKRYLI